ncbi:MAG: HemD protein, partial [bacterium]
AHGMKPQTPIALTRWGSWDRQKTLVSTLGEVVKEARNEEFSAQLVIVIGEVAALHRTIGWFEPNHA